MSIRQSLIQVIMRQLYKIINSFYKTTLHAKKQNHKN